MSTSLQVLEQSVYAMLQETGGALDGDQAFPNTPIATVFDTFLGGTLQLSGATVGFAAGNDTAFFINGTATSAPLQNFTVSAAVTADGSGFAMVLTATANIAPNTFWTLGESFSGLISGTASDVGFTAATFVLNSAQETMAFNGEASTASVFPGSVSFLFTLGGPATVPVTGNVTAIVAVENGTIFPTLSFAGIGVPTTFLGADITPTLVMETNATSETESVAVTFGLPLGDATPGPGRQPSVLAMRATPVATGVQIVATMVEGPNAFAFSDFASMFDFGGLLPPQAPFDSFELQLAAFEITGTSLSISILTTENWQISDAVTLNNVAFTLGLSNLPFYGTAGPVVPSITISAQFQIDSGTMLVSAFYPGFALSGIYTVPPTDTVSLQEFINAFSSEISDLVPSELTLNELSFALDPGSAAYSFGITLNATDSWEVVSAGPLSVSLSDMVMSLDYAASNLDLSVAATTSLGTTSPISLRVSAEYIGGAKPAWSVEAVTEPDITEEQLQALVTDLFGITLPTINLTGNLVLLATSAEGGQTTLYIALDYSTTLEGVEVPLTLTGSVSITPTDVLLSGSMTVGRLNVGGSYDFVAEVLKVNWKVGSVKFTGEVDLATSTVDLSITDANIGQLVDALVSAVAGEGSGFSLAPPFDVLNSIDITGTISAQLDFQTQSLTVTVTQTISLLIAEINSFTVSIDLAEPLTGVTFSVAASIADEPIVLPQWNVLQPQNTPTLGNAGTATLQIEYLLVGQHVAPPGGVNALTTTSILGAIDSIQSFYAQPPGATSAAVAYSPQTDWVVGAQLSLLEKTLDLTISIIFLDPTLYGIAIQAGRGTFAGLQFEILYQRVSSTIGVYEVELTLPTIYRTLSLGALTVILPSIMVQVYTNGNFTINLGYPENDDWANAASLQIFPFVGFGGFYFGDLSSATASIPPPTANGVYSPVIVIGVAVSAGVGDTFAEGPLSGGVSLTLSGIAEGTFAWLQGTSSTDVTQLYYVITGQFALVGNAYGVVNFVVVTARFDLTATIGATIQFSSGGPVMVTFFASVVVTATLTIDLGFKISLDFSFTASITKSFTLGSGGSDSQQLLASARVLPPSAAVLWVPVTGSYSIELLLTPHATVMAMANPIGVIKPMVVAMTYIQTDSTLKGIGPLQDPPFTNLCDGVLLWCINSVLQLAEPTVGDLLASTVTIAQLQQVQTALQTGNGPTASDVLALLPAMFTFNIVNLPDTGSASVSVFPMLSVLELTTPAGDTIDFGTYNPLSVDEINALQSYFAMMIPTAPGSGTGFPPPPPQASPSFAQAVMGDYFLLLCQNVMQAALTQATTATVDDESLDDVIAAHPRRGLTPERIAETNRLARLRDGVNGARSILGAARASKTTVGQLAVKNRALRGWLEPRTRLELPTAVDTPIAVSQLLAAPLQDQAGSVARILMQGLRPPYPDTAPRSLYSLTGQQFAAGGDSNASFTVTTTIPPAPASQWVTFNANESSISVDIPPLDVSMPVIEGFTSTLIPVRATTPRQFTLSGPILWTTTGETTWTIWQFPADLTNILQSGAQPLLAMHEAASSNASQIPSRELTGSVPSPQTAWTMLFPIIVQLVPSVTDPSTNLQFTYNLIGTDDVGTALLEQFLLAGGAAARIDVAFLQPGQASPSAGLTSNPSDGTTFFVVRTNLSTVSNPADGGADVITTPLGSAPNAMLANIWECSVVQSGGFSFYYSFNGQGLLPGLFNSNGEAEIMIIATLVLPEPGGLTPYVNTVAINLTYDPNENTVLYLEPVAPQGDVPPRSVPAVSPGTVGLTAQRSFDNDGFLAGNYQLLGYAIADDGGFGASPEGLPLAPIAGPPSYQTFVPIAPFAKDPGMSDDLPGDPPPDPYRGVGTEVALDLSWIDLFGNTINSAQPTQRVLYFDPLFPVTAWVGVGASYSITGGANGPQLVIDFDFNAARYQDKPDNPGWQAAAQTDLLHYAAVYYQIARNVDIVVTCTLDRSVSWNVTSDLVAYVLSIYTYLNAVATDQNPAWPNLAMSLVVNGLSDDPAFSDVIFPLQVQITIARDADLIDPSANIPGDPAVAVTSTVKASFQAQQTGGPRTLLQFALDLSAAFPELMVATQPAQSISGADAGNGSLARIWIVRFGPGGIACTYDVHHPSIRYFAVAPLAGTLVSVADVPLPRYESGAGLSFEGGPVQSFADVDLDSILAAFLAAVDQFLSVDYAAPTWLAWYLGGGPNGSDPVTQVLAAKATLARALAAQVQPLYETPELLPAELEAAQAFMEQQLLVQLSTAYAIDALVQFAATTNPVGGNAIPPRLYGAPVVDAQSTSTRRYSFSSLSVPMDGISPVTFAFTTNMTSETEVLALPVSVQFNHLQFQIEAVGTLGYEASSWLTFAIPFAQVTSPVVNAAIGVDLGVLEIPLPLRSFPTLPTLSTQKAVPAGYGSLDGLRTWDYQFSYAYSGIAQDEIGISMQSPVPPPALQSALATALLQFNSVYPAIAADLASAVRDQEAVTSLSPKAAGAMTAFAALAGAVANSLGPITVPPEPFDFVISESAIRYAGEDDVLQVAVKSMGAAGVNIPIVEIVSFNAVRTAASTADVVYYVYQRGLEYLTLADAETFPIRTVTIPGFDVLVPSQQSASAAIAIERNAAYGTHAGNDAFVLTTPFVKYATPVVPLLTVPGNVTVQMAQPAVTTSQINAAMQDFFTTFLAAPNWWPIQLAVSYEYQVTPFVPLPVTLPVILVPPALVTPGGQMIDLIAASLAQWLEANTPPAGQLVFNLALYGSGGSTLPVLTIPRLVLSVDI